ncbi:MAG: hypothetical protein WCE94_13055 [Candidatus Methanoperedens sp.]
MKKEIEPLSNSAEIVKKHSKDDILELLIDENPQIKGKEKYSQLIVVFETKKVNFNLGLIKGEYYQDGKLEYRGSLLLPIDPSSPGSIWVKIKDGESLFYGFTLDAREMKAAEKIMDFLTRSFEGSTIQDFIPFAGGKKKE